MTPDDDSSVRDSAADKLLTGLSLLPPGVGAPADDVALLAGLDVGSIAAGSTERALAVLTETGTVIESDGLFRLAAATRTSRGAPQVNRRVRACWRGKLSEGSITYEH